MAVNPNPIKDSLRSKRRKNRGFISLEKSSRKHRRAIKRSLIARTFDRILGNPGEVMEHQPGLKTWMCKSGGSIKYHCS